MGSVIGTATSELVLKTTPPRPPRQLLVRPRLKSDAEPFRDRALAVVQAPAGFGKTSLLALWRREFLAAGAAVAWFSAGPNDDVERFIHGLVLAVRQGCGRPAFGGTLLEGASSLNGTLEGVTAWLAEIAQSSLDLVLIVDEVERLPQESSDALAYLLHNTPQNLRIVVAGRGGLSRVVSDLVAYGQCASVDSHMLRFRLDETITLIRNRFGTGIDADTCARLHEVTEGWPLGLQLAFGAMQRDADPRAAVYVMSSHPGDLHERLVGEMLSKLPAADAAFLVRISAMDLLHPDLCRALTASKDAPEQLARLMRDTPLFVLGEDTEWCRLHTLARDALRARLAKLPDAEQDELHLRAMDWLSSNGLIEEAARHAYAAGKRELAYDLAERCLYEAMLQGEQGAVLHWLELVPQSELDLRPRLRMAAAWALALSDRRDEAGYQIGRILDNAAVNDDLRYECALILSAASYYADDPDRTVEIFEPWKDRQPANPAWLRQMHTNRVAACTLLRGEPAQARRQLLAPPRGDVGKGIGFSTRWCDFLTGLSYVWDGQVLLAEAMLWPAFNSAESDLGRRNPLTCMFASLLAVVAYESGRLDEATELLANRLDVLERVGTPETMLLGYRTAARIAAAQGREHRALDLLEGMYALGTARKLPRLCVASLTEQIRLHAAGYRAQTCRNLVESVDTLLQQDDLPGGRLWRRMVDLLSGLAHGYAAIAAKDWQAVSDALAPAIRAAAAQKMGRYSIEIMALKAFALHRNGADGAELIREAMNLAQTYGLSRTIVDGHPDIASWVGSLAVENQTTGITPISQSPAAQTAGGTRESVLRASPSMVLTPKEREVLELLARNLSNKEIANAMAVGPETIKWHLKNLFGKLDAGTRKQVVRRAQMLGLLESAE